MFGLRRALTLALACGAVAALSAPALADPATDAAAALRLAEQLQEAGRHESCAVEALRAAWLVHDPPPVQALELASRCLVQGQQASAALRLLRDARFAPTLALEPHLQTRACLLAALTETRRPLPDICSHLPAGLATWPAVAQQLLRGQWSRAQTTLAGLAIDAGGPARREQVEGWLAEALALPQPSPGLAAGLSAIVPGAGRVYIGRWQDGLSSLALVGLPGYFAADGFARDGSQSVRGWLLGTTAGILYLGNIYGSWIGAEDVRSKAAAALRARIGQGVQAWAAQPD